MILTARGIHVPIATPAPKPAVVKPPAARALVPVLRTQAQGQKTGQLLPKPTGPRLLPAAPIKTGQLPEPRPLAPAPKSIGSDTAVPKAEAAPEVPPKAAAAANVGSDVTERLSSLNAAIASLGRSLQTGSTGKSQGDKSGDTQNVTGSATKAISTSTAPSVHHAVPSGDEWA